MFKKIIKYLMIILLLVGISVFLFRELIMVEIVNIMGAPEVYQVTGNSKKLQAKFLGIDKKRKQIKVNLSEVASGFKQITDIQFSPIESNMAIVTEKKGKLKWLNLSNKQSGVIKKIKVIHGAEQGLLGVAFHPNFSKNGKIYLNYSIKEKGKRLSRVSEWVNTRPSNLKKGKLIKERILMRVFQPYPNHNAGQLQFGPDGMLYIGWGDGGFRADPKGNGQNKKALLGKMLRIDVDVEKSNPNGKYSQNKQYLIPNDNPFVDDSSYAPEIYALGLRNPWRYSFSPDGRLIVADVGQNLFEEIDIVESSKNYGWNVREGNHCFDPKNNCNTVGLTDPIYEYGRNEGQSLTGGYVYTNSEIAELTNKYVFADFISGRIWAFKLPDKTNEKIKEVYSLGKWPILIATFGRDHHGNIYATDFAKGIIYRLTKK